MFLLEAMAAGRPFVSTPVGAIAQLADSGGMLVPVGDHEALAAALIELLDDPGRAEQLGRRGQELCRATRSPELVDAIYAEVYREALAARPRAATGGACGCTMARCGAGCEPVPRAGRQLTRSSGEPARPRRPGSPRR